MAYLEHYGTPRHSGRYPWGSGKNPQHGRDLLSKIDYYKKKGYNEKEIVKAFWIVGLLAGMLALTFGVFL